MRKQGDVGYLPSAITDTTFVTVCVTDNSGDVIKMMRRRAPNRFTCINFPSRVEGWLDFYETEGQSTRSINVPWGPLYCVLQQDEQTLTSYCSEELSLTDVLFAELPRVRLDQPPKHQMKTIWETAHPTLQEEPEEDGAEHHIQHNTSLRSALGKSSTHSNMRVHGTIHYFYNVML